MACTRYLALMHTGGRSGDDIDSCGGVLPGYTRIIVRDGYHGYTHLTDALHAWCSATCRACTTPSPVPRNGPPGWPACSCTPATPRPPPAAGQDRLDPAVLDDLVTRYRAVADDGLWVNLTRHTATARSARAIARRFQRYEDMILRFATRPDLDIFTNNEAERTLRPVKVQQRSSGGCWRTIEGLADFAIVQSYLSTAAKWGISKLDALRALFNTPWTPPALEPSG